MSLARSVSIAAPSGVVLPFAGTTAPGGWFLCAGQAVSRIDYAALFTALGTTYGAGDGSTTFNVPDLRGRVPGGKDNMGGTAANRLTTAGSGVNGAALGAVGGAETHTLTTPQIPAHTHDVPKLNPVGGTGYDITGGSLWTYGAGASASAGSGNAHNNTQPTLVLNYIIKT